MIMIYSEKGAELFYFPWCLNAASRTSRATHVAIGHFIFSIINSIISYRRGGLVKPWTVYKDSKYL